MTQPTIDATHDPSRTSWVQTANEKNCDFPIQNLPFGLFSLCGSEPRFGVAIGDMILDVVAAAASGLLSGVGAHVADVARNQCSLNRVLALDPGVLTDFRRQLSATLASHCPKECQSVAQAHLRRQSDCDLHVPLEIGDYTDFFASIHHATATGALLKPDDPLPRAYKWVPMSYHARSSSVVASGAEIHRPLGQMGSRGGMPPRFEPTAWLDFELELGFYIGKGNTLGTPIGIQDAGRQIAGFCLLNDWSARDMQRWESVPLGPFLSKNFATTISPWIVTADALRPFRCAAMTRAPDDPQPLSYLDHEADRASGGLNVELSVWLQTAKMREAECDPLVLAHSNAKYLYWTPSQMVTHHASSGCNMRSGDLIGTGTLSGPQKSQSGSLLELSSGGREPVTLPNGETRVGLIDGDEVIFRGVCRRDGFVSIGFGDCRGRILPARQQ